MKLIVCILLVILNVVNSLYADQYDDSLFTPEIEPEILEDLLTHPLDINKCSVEDLLVLPDVPYLIATNIVNYRKTNGYYQNVNQLRQVSGVSDSLIQRIKPYLVASKPLSSTKKWLKVSGDFRWRLKMSGLDEPEYFYNRAQLWVGNNYHFGWVIRRSVEEELSPDMIGATALSWDNLWKYFLTKYWFETRNILWCDKIVFGNYKLQYNQGLIFYYPMNEFIRPVMVKAKGIQPDKETNANVNFRGLALEKKLGIFDFSLFYSDKKFDASMNSDGTIKTDLDSLRLNYGYIQSVNDLANYQTIQEKLFGGQMSLNLWKSLKIGIMGYDAQCSPEIKPPYKYTADRFLFKGNRNTVYGMNLNFSNGGFNLITEYAKNKDYGQAWLVQPMYNFSDYTLFLNLHKYDADYYNFHSSAISEEFGEDRNEEGIIAGIKRETKKVMVQTQYHYYRRPEPGWKGPVFGKYYGNVLPRNAQKLFAEMKFQLSPEWELYYKEQDTLETNVFKISSNPTAFADLPCYLGVHRLQVTWDKKKFYLRGRVEQKSGFVSSSTDGNGNKIDFNRWYQGYLCYLDGEYQLITGLYLQARIIYFNGPPVYIYLSEFEPLWYASYLANTFIPQGTGIRYYFTIKYKFFNSLQVWLKYENTDYLDDFRTVQPKHLFKVQVDYCW